MLFGVLNGVIHGKYQVTDNFLGGVVRGPVNIEVEPQGDSLNVTAKSLFGPVSVRVPGDKYTGQFTLFNHAGAAPAVQATHSENIHVTKLKPDLKSGYYLEENEDSHIILEAKLNGGERLAFY